MRVNTRHGGGGEGGGGGKKTKPLMLSAKVVARGRSKKIKLPERTGLGGELEEANGCAV